jgi:hypothetical protein
LDRLPYLGDPVFTRLPLGVTMNEQKVARIQLQSACDLIPQSSRGGGQLPEIGKCRFDGPHDIVIDKEPPEGMKKNVVGRPVSEECEA